MRDSDRGYTHIVVNKEESDDGGKSDTTLSSASESKAKE